ncbi:MAG: hypothetical protein IJD35_03505, partial [Clostridia bacterium]|nr:hypothetical protein [Clostridia bacterium]
MKTRKLLSVLLAVVLVLGTLAAIGLTVSADVTEIASAEDLLKISGDGEYKLTQDITLTGTIESFSGTLDGNGHTVTVSAPMFASLSGTVKNLKLAGSITAGATNTVGALANTADGATVDGCTSSVVITGAANGDYLRVGGLVGVATGSTVTKSAFDGSITLTGLLHKENDNNIGGIAA